jgi:large subunit ribosomal protein L2
MGKRIKVQRRGQGTQQFRAAHTGKIAPATYPSITEGTIQGVIRDLQHEAGRGAPLALVELENGESFYTTAPEGLAIDQVIKLGREIPIEVGNVAPLGDIPEGTLVCNIELKPGDGGKIARSSGSYATIIAHSDDMTVLKLPSKSSIQIHSKARATIGVTSGAGRMEKPFLKAGEARLASRAKGQVYPTAHGVKMTASSHPHGGGRHRRPGKSTTVGRLSPPGAKVGLIAARSSGRGGKRRRE